MTAAPRGRCRSGLPPDDIPGRASGQSYTVAEAGRPGSISVWPNQLNLTTPWLEPAGAAADRGHFTGAAWNWHPFAVEHAPAEGTAILLRSRGGTDGSNPLPSTGESTANLNSAWSARHTLIDTRPLRLREKKRKRLSTPTTPPNRQNGPHGF